jgi:hypothetical protein
VKRLAGCNPVSMWLDEDAINRTRAASEMAEERSQ